MSLCRVYWETDFFFRVQHTLTPRIFRLVILYIHIICINSFSRYEISLCLYDDRVAAVRMEDNRLRILYIHK